MGDFLRGNTALEITVANLIAARYVWKGNGEIPFAVVGEMSFAAFSFRQFRVYSPFPANMRVGQAKKAVQSPVVENVARKMTACQKRKNQDGYVVSVPLCVPIYKVYGR